MCSLWQRMGRGSRNLGSEAIAVVFAESKSFDSVCAEKEKKKRKRDETKAAKEAAKHVGTSTSQERPKKRQRTDSDHSKENIPVQTPLPGSTDQSERTNEEMVSEGTVPDKSPDTPQAPASIGDSNLPSTTLHTDEGSESQQISTTPTIPIAQIRESRKEVYSEFHREQSNINGSVRGLKGRSGGRTKKDLEIIDPAIEDIVNASERGLGCRRLPARIMFEEELVGE